MAETEFQLITFLSEKKELLEKAIPFLEEEHRCIVELDMAKLSSVMEQKSELFEQLQVASKRCRILVKQLAAELGVAEAKSLSPLLPKLKQPEQETLRGLQRALLESGATFEKLSKSNGDLLSGALVTVNRSLEFFGRLFNRSTTYSEAGRMAERTPSPRLLHREA